MYQTGIFDIVDAVQWNLTTPIIDRGWPHCFNGKTWNRYAIIICNSLWETCLDFGALAFLWIRQRNYSLLCFAFLGTDATHAEHIETIKTRMYIGVNNDGRFVPGQLGMGLVEGTCRCLKKWVSVQNQIAVTVIDVKALYRVKKDKVNVV